jgi:hypothetical protein
MVAGSARWLEGHGVFRLAERDSRFPRVGEWLVQHTDSGAVVLASLHSGSANYYSGRLTLRWDAIPPDRLGSVVAAIARRGERAYLVVDERYEIDEFNRRLAADRAGAVRVEPLDSIFTVQISELVPGTP